MYDSGLNLNNIKYYYYFYEIEKSQLRFQNFQKLKYLTTF